jgi:hypothetical protein
MHLVLEESETRGIVVPDSTDWMPFASEQAHTTILPIQVSRAIFNFIVELPNALILDPGALYSR